MCPRVATKTSLRLLFALVALAIAPLAAAHGREDANTILVHFLPGADVQGEIAALGDHQIGHSKTDVVLVRVHGGVLPDTEVAAYDALVDVDWAEPNFVAQSSMLAAPNDPQYGSQWALAKIQALGGWSLFPGSYGVASGVPIAVVDTGVDSTHPDLPNVLTASGANCVSGTCAASSGLDDNGHGTHVAGIAAAAANNTLGIAGVAYGSPMIPVKALDSAGNGTYAAISNGIIWAADHGAKVVNLSMNAAAYSKTMCDAVAYAAGKGVTVVAAAGNDSTSTAEYPAACPGAIGVAATDSSDLPASFSDYGSPDVFVSAPGVSIVSTWLGSGYSTLSGTSMASPYVAGVAALLLGQDGTRTPADVKRILASTSDKVGSGSYSGDSFNACAGGCSWNANYGYGRIDVNNALAGIVTTAPDFTLGASPATATVGMGQSAVYSVSTQSVAGFAGTVAFSVSGLPSGATATFSPVSVAAGGSSQLTVKTASNSPVGSYSLTITGTSGSNSHTASATLVVAKPDFTVTASPSSVSISQGQTASLSVSVGAVAGFTGSIALTTTGSPSGSTVAFSPTSVAAPGSSTLTIKTSATAAPGTYTVTITGTSSARVAHSSTVTLVVNPVGDFSFAASPSSLSVKRGSFGTPVASLAGRNGFYCTVALSNTAPLPAGVTATWSKTSILVSGTSTLTDSVKLAASSSAVPGTYTVMLYATCASLQHSVALTLTIT